ncbi:hypothetical protein BA895_15795 [Humibacillus sp. DSM 29435]|nr:hypothetical protein BA895_15795 [Humibacillus sp. DSM 29435]
MITRLLTRDPKRDTDQGLSSARIRFEKRAAAARRRPRVIAAVAVALLLAMGLVAWLGWFSPVFTADAVVVKGASTAQAAQVRRAAAVPLGGPVLRVDTAAVTRRLEADRQWADIAVERSLPHTVTITVRPREAALAVRTSSGRVEVVDGKGFAFRTVADPPQGVPLVTAGTTVVTRVGVTAALQALSALDPALRRTVSGVTVSAADQVKFTLTVKGARKTVVWGGPGDAVTKARLVVILLKQPGSTVDVSVPSSPVTR